MKKTDSFFCENLNGTMDINTCLLRYQKAEESLGDEYPSCNNCKTGKKHWAIFPEGGEKSPKTIAPRKNTEERPEPEKEAICIAEGCGKPAKPRGTLCSAHYEAKSRSKPLTGAPCRVEGCGNPAGRNGLCKSCAMKASWAGRKKPEAHEPKKNSSTGNATPPCPAPAPIEKAPKPPVVPAGAFVEARTARAMTGQLLHCADIIEDAARGLLDNQICNDAALINAKAILTDLIARKNLTPLAPASTAKEAA